MHITRIFSLLMAALLWSSTLAAASFGDQFKSWLPNFITEWWWPVEVVDRPSAAEMAELPGAENWLLLPDVSGQDQDFHWPTATIDPLKALERWQKAQEQVALVQWAPNLLPLAAGSSLRLISQSDEFPAFIKQYLQTFCLVKTISYQADRDQQLMEVANPAAINLLYAAPKSGATNLPQWLADFANKPAVLIWGGSKEALEDLPTNWAVIQLPSRDVSTEMTAARLLFTNETGQAQTLTYATPLSAGLDPEKLEKVDYYLNRAIRYRATPGAQLLVAKGGQIVYHKAYGHHTYRKKQNVYTSDLYDLASVTKAAATSLAVMYLYDQGKIDLNKLAADYLPELKRKAAGLHTVEQLLTHQTGLQSSLPVQSFLGREFVHDTIDEKFTIPLAPDIWLDENIPAKVIKGLGKVGYTKRRIYRYSDVNYVLLQQIVERIDGRDLATLLSEEIYGPLGLTRLCFKPFEQFKTEQCVPTARDNWMRGGTIRGYVHDEGAAMLGGVAGHAGLFATATDLAQLFQMLLNKGSYNGQQIFRPETVELFTEKSRYNYRSLGFDRLKGGWPKIVQAGASEATFGHTGFSGTCVWADPENDLVFVLLTNRIHPDPKNERLKKYNTRGRVHLQLYRSLLPEEV